MKSWGPGGFSFAGVLADGQMLASITDIFPNTTIFVRASTYSTGNRKLVRSVRAPMVGASALSFTRQNDRLAVATRQNTFRLLEVLRERPQEIETPGRPIWPSASISNGLIPSRNPRISSFLQACGIRRAPETFTLEKFLDNPQSLASPPTTGPWRSAEIGHDPPFWTLSSGRTLPFQHRDKAPVSGA